MLEIRETPYTEAEAAAAAELLREADSRTESSASRFHISNEFGKNLVVGLDVHVPGGFEASVPITTAKSSAQLMTVTTEMARALYRALDSVTDTPT